MLRVRNTLRWRWVTGADGRPKRESNARMVKWADGTMSLQLGNEIYDVTPSGGASLSSSASAPSSDRHFLCQLFGTERVFLHERAIAGQLTLRPATTNNRTHQERAKAIGQQATKHARLKYHEEAHPNPEKEEKERAEQRAKADKQRKRREAANRPRQRTGAGGSSARTYRKRVRRDSGDEDDEAQFSDDSVFARPSRGKRARSHEVGDYEEDDGFVVRRFLLVQIPRLIYCRLPMMTTMSPSRKRMKLQMTPPTAPNGNQSIRNPRSKADQKTTTLSPTRWRKLSGGLKLRKRRRSVKRKRRLRGRVALSKLRLSSRAKAKRRAKSTLMTRMVSLVPLDVNVPLTIYQTRTQSAKPSMRTRMKTMTMLWRLRARMAISC